MLKTRWGKILLLLLALRMGVFYVALAFPEGGVIIDSRAYLEMASALRQDGWAGLDRTLLHYTPGYPIFLLLSMWTTGTELVGVGFIQLALTGLVGLLLFWLGDRLGDPRAGFAAAVLYLISPNTALWSLTIMSETLFAICLIVAAAAWVISLQGGNPVWSLVAGVSLGAAAFVRPIGLPLIIIWLSVGLLQHGEAGATRRKALRSALLIGGYVLVLLPWVVRNWTTSGRLALADVPRGTFVRFNLAYVVAEAEGLSRDEAAALLERSIDSWQDEWDIVRRYPRTFVEEQVKGIARAAIGVESGVWARQLGYALDRQGSFDVLSTVLTEGPGQAFERLSALLRDPQTAPHASLTVLAVLHTLLLYLLALVAVALFWRNGTTARLVYVLAFLSAAYLLVAPGAAGQARFRIPVEPFLALLAGAGLSRSLVAVSRMRTGKTTIDKGMEAAPAAQEGR